ncbi:MAG: FMN-binding negative transcriptional regulator [Pirellula sp.]
MYVPGHFRQDDVEALHAFMQQYSFAILTSVRDGVPFATHLPLLLDVSMGSNGSLIGHVARTNPHWEGLDGEQAVAIFHGPHAYVSPAWYQAPNLVPTWNYIAVHAIGRVQVLHDRARIREIVAKSVATYEAARTASTGQTPWEFPDDSPVIEGMLGHIVGIEISIERLEGKWKLSQNHPIARRRQVIERLRDGDQSAREVAAYMQAMLDGDS